MTTQGYTKPWHDQGQQLIDRAYEAQKQFDGKRQLISKADRRLITLAATTSKRIMRRHRRTCLHCGRPRKEHAKGKCLFDSTSYAPGVPGWGAGEMAAKILDNSQGAWGAWTK